MKKLILALTLAFVSVVALADQYVNGYTRKDGTYVQGYTRSSPNSTVQDNFSYKGNTNPYTGSVGNNYYRNNPSSEYYNGGINNGLNQNNSPYKLNQYGQ